VERITLVKVGGAELKEGPALEGLVGALARMTTTRHVVVVHGGGPEIAELQQRLGLEPKFVEGLRVTDEESLRVAEMVLSGLVNKRLVGHLVMAGVRAIGLSGVDAGLLRGDRLRHPMGDLGRVGEIKQVQADCLFRLMEQGFTPVISPISLGNDGRPLNVNADHAALAIAGALRPEEAFFLTDVPGVKLENQVLASLGARQAEQMIQSQQITGGMIPKVRSALQAIAAGASTVRITNLEGLIQNAGTAIVA
jgi:acetylglutamate kinase